MSWLAPLRRILLGSPAIAAALYVATLIALIWAGATALADIIDKREQLNDANAQLAQFAGRKRPGVTATSAATPGGSVFVEGRTVTIAGAALVQRLTDAVAKVGGNVLSTQVELPAASANASMISVVANCELEQPALQQLLYDIEAGWPFLFVDQLHVQQSVAEAAGGAGRLRVLLTISGQWQGQT
ncbi:putative General secretion pathway protein M, GspM [Bradyrhizobium sp. ORS 285]|uniref:type II secretion system protein GspM n=1 Tax=Bradyrhizobium sp. ORS 285 TaxID=115808 RepID=UPI000240796A|nr:type II secretion system protein GspM [Bradyrhizobium sp. ORS 285]CCD89631.1 putative General secretion pathway protein M, GspM [Bradyrhizobium sp. ORS 285]SMX56310.1 putative General secretion pathway protein M, GspM [Bradyrhizobium sp. ORS 285]